LSKMTFPVVRVGELLGGRQVGGRQVGGREVGGGQEEVGETEEDQYGEDEDAGVFGNDAECCCYGTECETCGGGFLAEAIEGVDRGEEEEGETHVGGDKGAVGEQVGFEGEEKDGDDRGEGAEDLFGGEEDEQAEGEAEEGGHETAAQEDRVCVCGVEELPGVDEVLQFEEGDGSGRGLMEAHGEKRERGEEFYEGWVFGISAEVAVLPVFEAGEEMGRFIEGLGLLTHGADEQDRHDGEQKCGDEVGDAGRWSWWVESRRFWHPV
jgi:hypothetical protein